MSTRVILNPFETIVDYGDQRKTVSLGSLCSAVSSRIRLETPLLPPNCRYYVSSGRTAIVVLEFSPAIRDVYYHGLIEEHECDSDCGEPLDDEDLSEDDEDLSEDMVGMVLGTAKFRVPTPHLLYIPILGCEEEKFFIRSEYLLACSNQVNSADDLLYFCPFGNVGGDHRFCWGDLEHYNNSSFENLVRLSSVLERYFSSTFNSDLDCRKWESGEEECTTIGLLRKINNLDEFPSNLLLPIGSTFEEFLNSLLKIYVPNA